MFKIKDKEKKTSLDNLTYTVKRKCFDYNADS